MDVELRAVTVISTPWAATFSKAAVAAAPLLGCPGASAVSGWWELLHGVAPPARTAWPCSDAGWFASSVAIDAIDTHTHTYPCHTQRTPQDRSAPGLTHTHPHTRPETAFLVGQPRALPPRRTPRGLQHALYKHVPCD